VARDVTEATRRLVIERTGGRCEYCLIEEAAVGFPHQIDHIVSRKHGGSSRLSNLAYACVLCNRYKGTDIAGTDHSGEIIRVFDPRRDEWQQHFRIEGPTIQPLTPIGEATARLLRLNAAERVVERQLLQKLVSIRAASSNSLRMSLSAKRGVVALTQVTAIDSCRKQKTRSHVRESSTRSTGLSSPEHVNRPAADRCQG